MSNDPEWVVCQNEKCRLYQQRKLALKLSRGVYQIKHKGVVVLITNPDRLTVSCPACRRVTVIAE